AVRPNEPSGRWASVSQRRAASSSSAIAASAVGSGSGSGPGVGPDASPVRARSRVSAERSYRDLTGGVSAPPGPGQSTLGRREGPLEIQQELLAPLLAPVLAHPP